MWNQAKPSEATALLCEQWYATYCGAVRDWRGIHAKRCRPCLVIILVLCIRTFLHLDPYKISVGVSTLTENLSWVEKLKLHSFTVEYISPVILRHLVTTMHSYHIGSLHTHLDASRSLTKSRRVLRHSDREPELGREAITYSTRLHMESISSIMRGFWRARSLYSINQLPNLIPHMSRTVISNLGQGYWFRPRSNTLRVLTNGI